MTLLKSQSCSPAMTNESKNQNTRGRVLIVEDDPAIADVLQYNLSQEGYEVSLAQAGDIGLEMAKREIPNLMLLDLMLPNIDGLEVCRQLRADPSTKGISIIMLTAKSEETDQVLGFGVGADDYVTKPFSVKVLLQRVNALFRRRDREESQGDVTSCHGVVIDMRRHIAKCNGEQLNLTPSEFGLLKTLLRQAGRAFSRNELIDSVLGNDAIVLERTIDVHIRALRKKLGDKADLVETVRGLGYRFKEP